MSTIVRKWLQGGNPFTNFIKCHCTEEGNMEYCNHKSNKLALNDHWGRQKKRMKIDHAQVEDNLTKLSHMTAN